MTSSTFEEITRSEPERSLLAPMRRKAGRSASLLATVATVGVAADATAGPAMLPLAINALQSGADPLGTSARV